jgi:hypothetical protein
LQRVPDPDTTSERSLLPGLSQLAERDDLHNRTSHVHAADVGPLARPKMNAKAGLPVLSRQASDGIVSHIVVTANGPETALEVVELRRPIHADVICWAGTEEVINRTGSDASRKRHSTKSQSKSLHTL